MLHPHDLQYDPWTIRIVELAQGIRNRGHEAIVAYLPKKKIHEHDRCIRNAFPAGLQIVRLGARHGDLLSNYRTLCALAETCDLIHIQKCFASVACPGTWAAFRLGCPLHLDWDDNESALAEMTAPDKSWAHLIQVWERCMPRLVDSISVSSGGVYDLARAAGFPDARICKVPVGGNVERFHPQERDVKLRNELGIDPDAVLVLYCGQLEGAAYADLALEAVRMGIQRGSNLHLLVVGGGRGLPALQERVRELGESRVTLLGYVDADRVPPLMALADIAVACFEDNPVTRCKSPLKIAEYLASGVPTVGTDVGDVGEMIGDAGILVPPGRVDAFAAAIERYAHDPSMREAHRVRARERAETIYTWQRSADTLIAAYERLLA